ncbi:glycyl radical protein [Paenibacillus puldeungensis]|uniref:Glycyl radical protein n=1 Tax=Paenibacillus puldeungensis TaxID=696536 RepID=A0ABW3RRS4_9BACL
MYELKPVTDRIARIRKRYRDTKPKVCIERFKIVTDFYEENVALPAILKRAYNFKNLCEKMPVLVNEDEIIVGSLASMYRGSALFPEYSVDWLYNELHSGKFLERELDPYDLDQEDMEYLLTKEDFWMKNNLSAKMDASLSDRFYKILGNNVTTFGVKGTSTTPVGHFCANYNKAIRKGFGAIKAEAEHKMAEMEGKLYGEDAKKYQFYHAVSIVSEGIILFSKRYAQECRNQAAIATDAARKKELLTMVEGLDWIMENPCRNFREAAQCLFLYQIAMALDGNLHGLTIGRADQYLGSFYEEDLASGAITQEEAQEIIDAFCLKVSEMNKISAAQVTYAIGGYTSGQLLTLGGVTLDGEDATNPVTYMFLQSAGRLVLHDPPMSLRIHNETPEELWKAGIETTKICGGVPTFENDEIIIPALQGRGLSLESARNYCLIGCVEPGGCGDEWPACGGPGQESFWLLPNTLLLAINNGQSPMPGPDGRLSGQTGLPTGYLYDMKTFDEVLEATKKQIEYFVDWQVAFTNLHEYVAATDMPLPIVSATMDGCMEKGADVMWGGAKYNSTGTAAVGLGTLVDSLCVIKYMVYDKKLITAREMYDAVMTNWEGLEPLRQQVHTEVPRFGNDNDYVDELAVWVTKVYGEKVLSATGPRGNNFAPGLYPVATHVLYGLISWATPDGRKAGEPFSDGISPKQAMDKRGPSATLKSCAKIDHIMNSNGTLLNMRFHPKSLEGEGQKKLKALMQTYFDMGGMELQFNIVSADTLREAQKHPEEHKDLIVRIAGFSAYFVELYKGMQDDVINRTELGL